LKVNSLYYYILPRTLDTRVGLYAVDTFIASLSIQVPKAFLKVSLVTYYSNSFLSTLKGIRLSRPILSAILLVLL